MEGAQPKISVVVPALNEEKLLPDCLHSLFEQDYSGEYEIIIADNGSTDNTASIAREWGAKVIPCAEKRDIFYARQVGADAASGEIIAQADADTVYPRGWLRKIADQLATHPEASAIAGRFMYRDKFRWAKVECFGRHYINRLTVALVGRPLVVSGATFAFRRSAFLSVNGYKGLSFSPDQYGICERLSKVGKILYDQELYCLISTRSVQKSTITMVGANCAHIGRWGAYLIKSNLSALLKLAMKALSCRMATRRVYYRGSLLEKVVALTFDDGVNEPYTSQILDILASYNIKATFFVIGKNVELYPEKARRIIDEGHIVGNHSYTHKAHHALTDYGARDLQLAQEAIFNTLGIRPRLYRPPHGRRTPWLLKAVKREGMITVTWDVSANDLPVLGFLGAPSPKTFAQKIVTKTRPGKIILLHDGYGTVYDSAKSDRSLTVKALPLIIEQLQAKGYKFVTVPELLNVPAYL